MNMTSNSPFPSNFIWGAATAATQIEGAASEDGRTPSIWDAYAHQAGRTWKGDHADIACDHYHRWSEDVDLLKQLGVKMYRFSLSWPRVLPNGTGQPNEKALAVYDRLIDRLVEYGIEPAITLYHWDMPQVLFRQGGWLNRDSADWLAEYAGLLSARFSDRVRWWITLNEPQCFISIGHLEGWHAPGLKLPMADVLQAGHHALLAHGKSVQALRANSKATLQIGCATVGVGYFPEDANRPEDVAAARNQTYRTSESFSWTNTWWTDPIYLGHYPADALERYSKCLPEIRTGDMELICQPVDFCGFNHYFGEAVRAGKDGKSEVLPQPSGCELTTYNWPITPDSIYWYARFMHERYALPLLVTENGTASADWVNLDGEVRDPGRIDYVHRNLLCLRRLLADGIPVLGYMYWSLLDNFEWSEGYRIRFGLVHTNYQTQKRTPKSSFHWYRDVIAANGANL